MIEIKKTTIIEIVVMIVIVAGVLVPLTNTSQSKPDYWQYDDYKEINSDMPTVDGDVFEIIEVGGKSYIHAKNVGQGEINGKKITVHKAILDLIFMCGQSNAAYRNADPDEVTPIPLIGTSYYFGLENRSGPTAEENNTGLDISNCQVYSMIDENGELRIGDKAPSYAAEYYSITGHKIYWVCGAIGNKSISQFAPTTGFMWVYMDNILSAAINSIDTDKFSLETNYYLWCQGEANTSWRVDVYKEAFLDMHDALLDGSCAGVNFKGCIMSQTRSANGGNASIAQLQLSEEYSTIYMGTTVANTFTIDNGLIGPDNLHYSQLGNNKIGSELGKFVGHLVIPYENVNPIASNLLSLIPLFCVIGLIIAIVKLYIV